MITLELALGGATGSRTGQRLDGVSYFVEVQWIQGEGAWLCSLEDADGTPLALRGRRMAHGVDLLNGLSDSRLPPGALVVWDFSNQDIDPGRTDLDAGGSVRLVYASAAELAAATGAA